MSDRELSRYFEDLAPPPGGLSALRRQISRRRGWRRAGLRLAAGFAVLAAVTLVALRLALPAPAREPGVWLSRSDLYAVRLGLVEPPSEPVTVPKERRGDTALQRVPTSDPRVVFYRVGMR